MKNIQKARLFVQKYAYAAAAFELVFALFATTMLLHSTAVAGQITSRSIQMSDSGKSGGTITTGVGSGTNVAYKVTFNPTSTSTAIAGIVVDFCSNSALVGDSCTAPTGFNVNRSTTTVATQTGCGTGTMSTYTSDTTNNRIIITRASPGTPSATCVTDIGNGTSNGFTNPSSNGTFYARVYTYGTQAGAQGHTSGAPTGYIDYGGIALSVANIITITARVQETLVFCVFGGAAPNSNCVASGSSTTPALTLGHTSGTTPYIDATAVDTTNAYMQVSTNAAYGALVKMHSSVTNGGLDSGGGNIPPVGSGAATPSAINAGTAAFGMRVGNGTGGTGTLNADPGYYDSGNPTYYGMDTATSGSNVTTTYGDTIANTNSLPAANVNSTLTFGATASGVTPAGVYSANLALIATGTF